MDIDQALRDSASVIARRMKAYKPVRFDNARLHESNVIHAFLAVLEKSLSEDIETYLEVPFNAEERDRSRFDGLALVKSEKTAILIESKYFINNNVAGIERDVVRINKRRPFNLKCVDESWTWIGLMLAFMFQKNEGIRGWWAGNDEVRRQKRSSHWERLGELLPLPVRVSPIKAGQYYLLPAIWTLG